MDVATTILARSDGNGKAAGDDFDVDEEYEVFLRAQTDGMTHDEAEKYIAKRRSVDCFTMNKRLLRDTH